MTRENNNGPHIPNEEPGIQEDQAERDEWINPLKELYANVPPGTTEFDALDDVIDLFERKHDWNAEVKRVGLREERATLDDHSQLRVAEIVYGDLLSDIIRKGRKNRHYRETLRLANGLEEVLKDQEYDQPILSVSNSLKIIKNEVESRSTYPPNKR